MITVTPLNKSHELTSTPVSRTIDEAHDGVYSRYQPLICRYGARFIFLHCIISIIICLIIVIAEAITNVAVHVMRLHFHRGLGLLYYTCKYSNCHTTRPYCSIFMMSIKRSGLNADPLDAIHSHVKVLVEKCVTKVCQTECQSSFS